MADELEQELLKRAIPVASPQTGKPEPYGSSEAADAVAPIWGMSPTETKLQMMIDRGGFKDMNEYYQAIVALETERKFRQLREQLPKGPSGPVTLETPKQ